MQIGGQAMQFVDGAMQSVGAMNPIVSVPLTVYSDTLEICSTPVTIDNDSFSIINAVPTVCFVTIAILSIVLHIVSVASQMLSVSNALDILAEPIAATTERVLYL
jgi:hypothetical protein